MKMQNSVIFVKQKFEKKVRDHCHYTGKYRSAAHSICNSKYSVPKRIPIVFYDGSNYHKRVSRRILKTIYLFRRKY